ncbi:hypothetical protein ACSBPQ_05945 [Stenotrophomonas sp. JC08]|uniref:hypothetical protein n=1 Tax=Stenotrophomonas sp. JC08 TaxID=3445779 RepID=UPI003FA1A73C
MPSTTLQLRASLAALFLALLVACSPDSEDAGGADSSDSYVGILGGFALGDSKERVTSLEGNPHESKPDAEYETYTYYYHQGVADQYGNVNYAVASENNSSIQADITFVEANGKSEAVLICVSGDDFGPGKRFWYANIWLGMDIKTFEALTLDPLNVEYKDGGAQAIYRFASGASFFIYDRTVGMICLASPVSLTSGSV